MLIQFTVQNFLSFDGESTFSMLATPGDISHPLHIVSDTPRKIGILRAAALYGANASGKSNLVKAIGFARNLIVNGTRPHQTTGVIPFKLRAGATQQPSRFSFVVRHESVQYEYGFAVMSERIVEEWLFETPKTRERKLFERTTNENNKVTVEFGSEFTRRGGGGKAFWDFLAKGTRPNQLFLSEIIERNQSDILPVVNWFQNRLKVIDAEYELGNLEFGTHMRKEAAEFMSEFLRKVSTGIDRILTTEKMIELNDLDGLTAEHIKAIKSRLSDNPYKGITIITPSDKLILRQDEDGKIYRIFFSLQHKGKDSAPILFDLTEESEGTQRLLHLLPMMYSSRHDEAILVIDELDRKLHPLISWLFVQEMLAENGQAALNSQLIFTTHETHLLDLNLLRRDEIWFAEKDEEGASHLHSLAEFKIRPDLQIEKGYLNGRFGAIPFIGDVSRLLSKSSAVATNTKAA